MPGDRIELQQSSGRLGPKADLLVYEVVQGGHHESTTTRKHN